jgi:hypothetical protein
MHTSRDKNKNETNKNLQASYASFLRVHSLIRHSGIFQRSLSTDNNNWYVLIYFHVCKKLRRLKGDFLTEKKEDIQNNLWLGLCTSATCFRNTNKQWFIVRFRNLGAISISPVSEPTINLTFFCKLLLSTTRQLYSFIGRCTFAMVSRHNQFRFSLGSKTGCQGLSHLKVVSLSRKNAPNSS